MPVDLTDIVRADGVAHLGAYFDETARTPFTGRWFETLAGGGDRAETRDRVTFDDLLAVQALSVQVPPETGRELTEGGALGGEIGDHLRRIPADVEIDDPAARELLGPKSDAVQAWNLLVARRGIDYVIAGKLLARKRPRLIPVYDSVVSCQFGWPESFWLGLHERFLGDGGALRAALTGAGAAAGVPAAVSPLRMLDVVLWMRHRREHQRHLLRRCPGFGTVALRPA